jgi:FkbM family methyltransferase
MEKKLARVLSEIQPHDLNDYTVVVFGAGNTSVLYQKCFLKEGVKPEYYIDNNISKQSTTFQGVQVISLEKLTSLQHTFTKPILVLICSLNINMCYQIKMQLRNYPFLYTTIDTFVLGKNKHKILQVYDFLEDEVSKEAYAQVIQSRILNMPIPENMVSTDQYFMLPPFLAQDAQETFVDLGAYTGDTMEQYIAKKMGVFYRIYAFEPEKQNFTAMTHRAERLKNEWGLSNDRLALVQAGAGAKTEQALFTSPQPNKGNAARLGANFSADKTEAAEEAPLYALDDYFEKQKVSFIKADIESYELDMLQGAESIIKRDKPLLAVCIYHNASDMYEIPLFVKMLCPEYKIKIRHHTYSLFDTVLYAYV